MYVYMYIYIYIDRYAPWPSPLNLLTLLEGVAPDPDTVTPVKLASLLPINQPSVVRGSFLPAAPKHVG